MAEPHSINLERHYRDMWEKSRHAFERGQFAFDSLIDSNHDTRYGITLLARPSQQVKQNVISALEELRAIAPNQYYYPQTDLHLTILSIISCYEGFSLDDIDRSQYQNLVRSVVDGITPFRIQFRGVTASPSCIIVQGFPEDQQLETVRNSLRFAFRQTSLQHSIDKRYRLQTAHMTAVRFKKPLSKPHPFIDAVAHLRDRTFGSCTIEELELVGNDWYQQQAKVKLIETFSLG